MELLELVAVVAAVDDNWKCPFDHEEEEHDKTNVLPPPKTKNNATKLSKSLDDASEHLENLPISFAVDDDDHDEEAQFTAHHIVPGNESWPDTELKKWVDARESKIVADIGYDVNRAYNGVDLPGHTAAPEWTGASEDYRTKYAFACMLADGQGRQFHDRHAAYSEFVVNTLDKISLVLDNKPMPGCGEDGCGGDTEPFSPPYGLLTRLEGVSLRLETRLRGSSDKWRKPIMTSRFALMYKERLSLMSEAQARKELKKKNFKYGE